MGADAPTLLAMFEQFIDNHLAKLTSRPIESLTAPQGTRTRHNKTASMF